MSGQPFADTLPRPANGPFRLGWWVARRRLLGYVGIAAYLLIVFAVARPLGHLQTGDSNHLVEGARRALECIRQHNFVGCGRLEGSVQTEVFAFPLLQYLPAGLLAQVGVGDSTILTALGVLSFLGVLALLVGIMATFRSRPRLGALIVLSLLTSSLMYQSTSAFGEALSASLVGGAVLAAISRRPFLVVVLVFFASIGKETLWPFVAVLALVCARSPDDGWLPPKKMTLAIGGAALSAFVVNSLFNVFRFGELGNPLYLDPALRTPGISRKIDFSAAIMLSPSSGVMWFWPVFTLVALGATGVALIRVVRTPRRPDRYLPMLVLTALLVTWIALLSSWFSPFGWIAYGPRLQVPLLAGWCIAAVHVVGASLVKALRRSWIAAVALIVAVVAGSVQLGSPWGHQFAINQLIMPSGRCPGLVQMDVYSSPSVYFSCASNVMWRMRPVVLDDVISLSDHKEMVAWAVALLGCLLLVWYLLTPRIVADAPSETTNKEMSA